MLGYGKLLPTQIAQICKRGPLSYDQVDFLDKNGYLVIPAIITAEESLEYINEIWDKTIVDSPIKIQPERPLDPIGELTKEQIKDFKNNWKFPGKHFGAINMAPVYHLENSWKVRQNPELYQIYAQIYNESKLWTTIDRVNVKPPTFGAAEFLHWDWDPFHPKDIKIQSILNLSERVFTCIPGSNNSQWLEKFKEMYTNEAFHQDITQPQTIVQIKKEVDRELWNLGRIMELDEEAPTLNNCLRKIVCPAGSMLLFTSNVLHAVCKNTTKKIMYASYISYDPVNLKHEDRVHHKKGPSWTGWVNHPHCNYGDSCREDRIRSFNTGTAPFRFSGGNLTYFIPKRIMTMMLKYWKEEYLKTHPRTGKKMIVENLPSNYTPPVLTDLGKKLLGLIEW